MTVKAIQPAQRACKHQSCHCTYWMIRLLIWASRNNRPVDLSLKSKKKPLMISVFGPQVR